jgi:NAD(P)-dependent dehydrogenase (short-subunit alcohol dehydrogenase family)
VGKEEDVHRLCQTAIRRFGQFDTWVNNAGTSIFGRLTEVPHEDSRRLFEMNFWGLVYGSLEAIKHFGERKQAGALINVGSVLSDRAIPIQGMYCATKHAVKAFTDALRMELEAEGAPISVTLVKPSSIDTPFPKRAKNWMDQEPTLPPPIYSLVRWRRQYFIVQ